MNDIILQACLNYLNTWKAKGLKSYQPGENVLQAQLEFFGVCCRLRANGNLPGDIINTALIGLARSSHPSFAGQMEFLKNANNVGSLVSLLSNLSSASTKLDIVESIFNFAVNLSHSFSQDQTWIFGVPRGQINACFNCEDEDCYVSKCKLDTTSAEAVARIKKRRDAFNKDKLTKEAKPKNTTTCNATWESKGVDFVGGVPHSSCNHCGLTLTHTTGTHDAYMECLQTNRPFVLPPNNALILARVAAATSQVPSLSAPIDTSGQLPLLGDKPHTPSPKISLSVSSLRKRLDKHETHSDSLYAAQEVNFMRNELGLD